MFVFGLACIFIFTRVSLCVFVSVEKAVEGYLDAGGRVGTFRFLCIIVFLSVVVI